MRGEQGEQPRIDNAILDAFRKRAEAGGVGYQTMMNEALKQFLAESEAPLTEARLRVVLDEALKGAESPQSSGATRKPAVKRRESIR